MLRGQSPIAGAGEIREYSVDTASTIADSEDHSESGEERDGDLSIKCGLNKVGKNNVGIFSQERDKVGILGFSQISAAPSRSRSCLE